MAGRPCPHFPGKFLQYHLVEDPRQRVERSLDPPRVGGGYHPVVHIKKRFFLLQLCMSLFLPPLHVVPSPDLPSLRFLLRLVVISVFPPVSPATSYSQCRNTVPTTTLKMVGDSVSPCATPLSPRKGYL